MAVLLAVIGFQGFATHTIGATAEPEQPAGSAAPLQGSRPILRGVDGRLRSDQPPPGRRVALTFDDGPDATWTPAIAAVLRRYGVHATFFVVGSEAARHPDIVRMLERDGHELGNHTFTHATLSSGPLWLRRLQLSYTEAVTVGITGHYTRLVRPPYSATSDAVTPSDERSLAALAGRRYLVTLADLDSEDWKRHGATRIAEAATPRGTQGGVVMFHDGGGDRRQTVQALELLIPRLRARGFRFVTAGELAGLSPSVTAPTATVWERRRGEAFAAAVRLAFALTKLLAVTILAVGVLVALRAVLIVSLAAVHSRAARRRALPDLAHTPSVVVLVPAYNEAVGIERAVRSLAESDYPDFEIVVVDDGSADGTGDIVETLGLERVRLIRQQNAGKAAALNAGIVSSTAEIVVMVDADTVFEPSTLRRLVQPFAEPSVGAVAGNTKVGNRRGLLGNWQHIEYVTGFNLDRRMYEILQCTPTVPGAIGAFRRTTLEEVGGVSGATLAEDTDLTLAVGRTGRRVVYVSTARAWTEAPSTLSGLWRQRYRWSYGTMQAVWKHKGAILSRDPRDARIGRRALPYMIFFQIALPIAAPLIDLFAGYGLLFTDRSRVLVAFGLFNLAQVAIAAYAFRLDREPLRPLWTMPLQQFLYRQLMYLVIIESTISALVGLRAQWQHIERTGDVHVGSDPREGEARTA